MPHPIDTLEFWVEDYTPTIEELEALYAFALEAGKPLELETLSAELIRRRVARLTTAQAAARKGSGVVYSPADRYEPGQKLAFPALDGLTGSVLAVRPGNNPSYGAYDVVQIKTDQGVREFVAGFAQPHILSATSSDLDPAEVAKRFSSIVAPALATVLGSDREWVHHGHQWTLRGLLPEVNVGHVNLAEAVVMLAGGPLSTAEFLPELELTGTAANEAKEFALVMALSRDGRFRNVGALEAPLWALASQLGS